MSVARSVAEAGRVLAVNCPTSAQPEHVEGPALPQAACHRLCDRCIWSIAAGEDRMKTIWMSALVLGSIALSGAAPASQNTVQDTVASRFEAMKDLVGVWRRADKPESPLRIRFSLTAGGTVLVEEWLRGDQPHSLTLYHRDGSDLLATHYCPQGNQPRLVASTFAEADALVFKFRDATDLDAQHESHLVELGFELSAPDQMKRSETYRQGGADEASELHLVRE